MQVHSFKDKEHFILKNKKVCSIFVKAGFSTVFNGCISLAI